MGGWKDRRRASCAFRTPTNGVRVRVQTYAGESILLLTFNCGSTTPPLSRGSIEHVPDVSTYATKSNQKRLANEPNPTRNVQKIRGRREGTHTSDRVRVLLDPRDKFFVRLYIRTRVMFSCYSTPAKKKKPARRSDQLQCGHVIVPKASYQLCRQGVLSCRVGGQTSSIQP